tara:strand:+ start:24463 stop:25518 length:1056 start_codon:yes stop_codon:yes gene_type:complete
MKDGDVTMPGCRHLSCLLVILGLMITLTPPAPAQPAAVDSRHAGALELDPRGIARPQIEIWPDGVGPGSEDIADSLTETVVERFGDPAGLRDRYITGITRPFLTVFQPDEPDGSAVLIMPGGGYQRVVLDKEGYETAEYLAAHGVTAFILAYRLPGEGHDHGADVPLQDAQRALRVIRSGAAASGIDPARITAMGFSAGGHVAGSLMTRFDASVYAPLDTIDELSARPDSVALIYPVTAMTGPQVHAGSRALLLGTDTPDADQVATYDIAAAVGPNDPPLFIVHALDDTAVPPENALQVLSAYRALQLPVEAHFFAQGGHGFGRRYATGLPAQVWTDLLLAWIPAGGQVPG